jgi:hypothetical protein
MLWQIGHRRNRNAGASHAPRGYLAARRIDAALTTPKRCAADRAIWAIKQGPIKVDGTFA